MPLHSNHRSFPPGMLGSPPHALRQRTCARMSDEPPEVGTAAQLLVVGQLYFVDRGPPAGQSFGRVAAVPPNGSRSDPPIGSRSDPPNGSRSDPPNGSRSDPPIRVAERPPYRVVERPPVRGSWSDPPISRSDPPNGSRRDPLLDCGRRPTGTQIAPQSHRLETLSELLTC